MERLSRHFSNSIVKLLLFVFLFSLFMTSAYAKVNFPLPPRFSANALGSDYAVGEADVMLPVKGDSAHNLYIDPNLAYGSDNQGYADLGLGYRWIHNEMALLGAYLFGGYSRLDNNARLWVLNPGIEALGSRWDAHVNGYAVMGERNQSAGSFLGPVFFTGHSAFANFYYVDQHAGHGGDVQVGYQLFPQSSLKGYVGSYFFAPSQVSDIWGGAAGLEYWFDHYIKVFGAYTYDNVRHSTGALGVGVEFGGTRVHRVNPSLEERITDPVERYLSELGRGSAIPSRNTTTLRTGVSANGENIAIPEFLHGNIAFFSQTGGPNNGGTSLTLANCTAERPCGPTDFSQPGVNTLNALLPNTTMYFNGGSYPAVNVAGTGAITLNAGQSLHSRTADYTQAAPADKRSVFNGALILNSNNILENIVLLSTGDTTGGSGIQANNAMGILITGSEIGSETNRFTKGINFQGSSQGIIAGSVVFGSNVGVAISDSSQLHIVEKSGINVSGQNSTGATAINSSRLDIDDVLMIIRGSDLTGLSTSNSATIVANMMQMNVSNAGGTSTSALGLLNASSESMTVNNSSIDLFGNNSQIKLGANIIINDSSCSINDMGGPC